MNNPSTTYREMQHSPMTAWSLWWRRFSIRLMHWEYWPIYVFNIPVVATWLWHALRSRDLFFFTLTNPGIETGGFFGEKKSEILRHIPDNYKPKTVLFKPSVNAADLEEWFGHSGLSFPIIAKPEVGERGWLIKRINNLQELTSYVKDHPIDLILQSYVDLPMELSIMVYKMPDGSDSKVTSICQKEFLHVKGDGVSTLEQLIIAQDRALLQYEILRNRFGEDMNDVLGNEEYFLLEPIGNHCRGTKFLNRNEQIDDQIREVMIPLLSSMPDVHYGRFDMRVDSWEALREGRDLMVLEFNGASSDPAHIYDPGYSLFRAYKDIFYHWKVMARIAGQNRRLGLKPIAFNKLLSALILYFRYKRTN